MPVKLKKWSYYAQEISLLCSSTFCSRNVPITCICMCKKCAKHIGGNFCQEEMSTNLPKPLVAKFSPNLFWHTPKSFPGRISAYCIFVTQLHIGPSLCVCLFCFALMHAFNGHVCLYNCRPWQRWRRRPSRIWELRIMLLQNCHVAQQSHGASHTSPQQCSQNTCAYSVP